MGKENAFLIGDMFPITDKYIKKPYTFSGVHYVVQNKITLKEVQKRSARYLVILSISLDTFSTQNPKLLENQHLEMEQIYMERSEMYICSISGAARSGG